MSRAQGANVVCIMQEESTFGDDPGAPNAHRIPILENSIAATRNLLDNDTLTGIRDKTRPELGMKDVGGDIKQYVDATTSALMMKQVFGDLATVGASDPYTHTLKPGALPSGFLWENGYTDIAEYYKYNGNKISGFDLEVKSEGYAEITYKTIGKKRTRAATSFDATPVEYVYNPFTQSHITLKEGGVALGYGTALKVSVDNELDEDGHVIDGTNERRDLPEGQIAVTGELEVMFENDVLLAKARASIESSIEVVLDLGVSPARKLTLTIPEIIFEEKDPEVSGAQGIKVALPFRAYFEDGSEGVSIQAVFENGLTTL